MTAVRLEARIFKQITSLTSRVAPRRQPSPRWAWLAAGLITGLFLLWVGYRLVAQPGWISHLPAPLTEGLGLVESATGVTLAILWLALGWWAHHRHRTAASVTTVDDLYALSPADFEKYVGALFRRKGYVVKLRGRSGDHGVDLELIKPTGRRAIVQCKRYRTTIGPDIVRELFGTMIHERVAHAFLVTTAEISASSRDWARGKPMTLIDGRTLVRVAAALRTNESIYE